jgi:hypothetical protein
VGIAIVTAGQFLAPVPLTRATGKNAADRAKQAREQ